MIRLLASLSFVLSACAPVETQLPLPVSQPTAQASQPAPEKNPPQVEKNPVESKIRAIVSNPATADTTSIRAVGQMLREGRHKGIWVVAPENVRLDRDNEISIVAWDYYDKEKRGYRYLSSEGAVVVTRVESRETMGALIQEPKEPADDTEPELPPIEAGENLLVNQFQLRERVDGLPWRAGTYLIDLLLDGQTSNRLVYKIGPGTVADSDPAVAEYIAAQKGKRPVDTSLYPTPSQFAEFPTYRVHPNSPDVPEQLGISLAAERVSVYKNGAKSAVHGSYRLAIPSGYYRKDETLDGPNQKTATVPISLVITGNDLVGPFIVSMRLPTYDKIDRGAESSIVTGYFSIDLFAMPETSKVAQTNTVFGYSGAIRSEPIQMSVITSDMLE